MGGQMCVVCGVWCVSHLNMAFCDWAKVGLGALVCWDKRASEPPCNPGRACLCVFAHWCVLWTLDADSCVHCCFLFVFVSPHPPPPPRFWHPGKTTFIRMLAGLLKADPDESGKEPEIEGFAVRAPSHMRSLLPAHAPRSTPHPHSSQSQHPVPLVLCEPPRCLDLCLLALCTPSPVSQVSYKPQKISPKFAGSVRMLLHEKIRDSFIHPQFVTDVIKPMQIDPIIDQEVGTGPAGLGRWPHVTHHTSSCPMLAAVHVCTRLDVLEGKSLLLLLLCWRCAPHPGGAPVWW